MDYGSWLEMHGKTNNNNNNNDNNNNNNGSNNKYRESILSFKRMNKNAENDVKKFIDVTTEKVKNILKLSNKLAELQMSLSRCYDWLNKLTETNLSASEDAKYDDNLVDDQIFTLLEDGQELSETFQSRISHITNILNNLELFNTNLDTAKDCIYQQIREIPKLNVKELALKTKKYEKSTKEYEARKFTKTQKRRKSPLEENVEYNSTNTMENYNYGVEVSGFALKSRGHEDSSVNKRSNRGSLNDIYSDDENIELKNKNSSSKKLRMLDRNESNNQEADDEYEFAADGKNSNNYNEDGYFVNQKMITLPKKISANENITEITHQDPVNGNNNCDDNLIDLT